MIFQITFILACLTSVAFCSKFYLDSVVFQVSADSYQVFSNTTYYITIKPTSTIPFNSSIIIIFPSDYTALLQGQINCSASYVSSILSSPCSILSNVFTYAGCCESFPMIIAINIYNITNPGLAKVTGPFTFYIYDNSNNTIIQRDSLGPTVSIVPSLMSFASVAVGSQTIALETTWNYAFTLTYPVASGGLIQIDAPVWNSNLTSDPNKYSYYCNSTVSCKGILSNLYLDLPPILNCSCSQGTIQIVLPSLFVGTASVNVSQIINPPSPQSVSGFVVSSKNNGYYIEKSSDLSVSVSFPANLTIYSITLDSNTVSAITNYYFVMSCATALTSSYQIQVSFPSDFLVTSSASVTGFVWVNRQLTTSVASNVIIAFAAFQGYIDAGTAFEFQISGIQNAYSTQPSSQINASVLTSTNQIVCSSYSGLSVTASPGSFNQITFTPSNPTIYAETIYTINLTLNQPVQSGSFIEIIFPLEIEILPRNYTNCYKINLGLSNESQCLVNGSFLRLVSGFDSEYAGKISFAIDGVTNPSTTAVTQNFQIKAYSANNFLILSDDSVSISASPGKLLGNSLSYSSVITGDVCNYTISVNISHKVPKGGIFYVVLPTQISFVSPSCTTLLGFSQGFTCLFGKNLSLINGFSNDFEQGTLALTINGLKNPATTKPSDSFQVFTYNDSYVIDYIDSGLIATMKDPHLFKAINVSTSSSTVGAISDYSILLTPFNPVYNLTIVKLVPPPQVLIPLNPSCLALTKAISVTCVSDPFNTYLNATLVFSINITSESFGFVVKSCKNPESTQPSNSFGISDFINQYSIDQQNYGINVTMLTPGTLMVNLSLSDYGIGKIANLTFAITTFNTVPSGGYFEIIFPVNVSVPLNPECLSVLWCNKTNDQTLQVFPFLYQKGPFTMVFQINEVLNPVFTSTLNFSVTSKISDYFIDSDSAIPVTYLCESPCLTCETYAYQCLSCVSTFPYFYLSKCYQTCPYGTTGVDNQCLVCEFPCTSCFKHQSNCTGCSFGLNFYMNTCYSLCPNGTFAFNGTCVDCVFQCQMCASLSKCSQCAVGYSLFNYSCVSNCPQGTISLNSVCETCLFPCSSCFLSTNSCSECIEGYFLYQNSCFLSCPATTLSGLGKCFPCINNCLHCSKLLNNCTSCISGFNLFKNSCLATCPSGFISSNLTCTQCLLPCLSCANFTDFCTSCVSGRFLYNNECLPNCPQTTTNISNICITCQPPCSTCMGSPQTCTSCLGYYYLYQSSCLNECPSGSVISGTNCEVCSPLCSKCAEVPNFCIECVPGSFMFNNSCQNTCPLHTFALNGLCIDCKYPCQECVNSTFTCTVCLNDLFLYQGQCMTECPQSTYALSDNTCIDCGSLCSQCSAELCTECIPNYLLFNNQCLLNCPQNFTQQGSTCTEALCSPGCKSSMLNNSICDSSCNVANCNYDGGDCSTSLLTLSKLQQTPMPFTLAGIGTSAILLTSKVFFKATAFVSSNIAVWGLIETSSWITTVSKVSETQPNESRQLLASNSQINTCLSLLIVCIVLHFIINITFSVFYLAYLQKNDPSHREWINGMKGLKLLVLPLSIVLSFKFIRVIDGKVFGCRCFQARFEKRASFYRSLIFFSYLSIVFTTLPIIASLVYVLIVYEKDSSLFLLALDSLIITILVLIITIYEIIVGTALLQQSSRIITTTEIGLEVTSPACIMDSQKFTIFNSNAEDTSRISIIFDTDTAKVYPEPQCQGYHEVSFKNSFIKEDSQDIDEKKSSVRDTEENFIGYEDPQIETLEKNEENLNNSWENYEKNEENLNNSGENYEKNKINQEDSFVDNLDLQESSSEVIPEGSDFSVAELESIYQIPSPYKSITSFKNENSIEKSIEVNEIDSDRTPIDIDQYLLEFSGPVPNKNKSFDQSHSFLEGPFPTDIVGETLKKEEDFDFAHAFEDPDDPEAVVVWNRKVQCHCIVKKGFKGLPKLDPNTGLPIVSEMIVSRYECETIQIDPKNCHYANIVADGSVFRVRRNFIGAQIVEVIDRQVFHEKKNRKIEFDQAFQVKNFEEDDFETGFRTPDQKKLKKTKKIKIPNDIKSIEAIYLQRLQPSISDKKNQERHDQSVSHLGNCFTSLNTKPTTRDSEFSSRPKSIMSKGK